jgi:hypothetical protein
MKEFIIRGVILEAKATEEDKGETKTYRCPSSNYEGTQATLRVEVWDKDVRFNDRLGSATTQFGAGIFEVRFTEQAFRQDPGETELYPDVFFEVFRQHHKLFDTESELLPRNFFRRYDANLPDLSALSRVASDGSIPSNGSVGRVLKPSSGEAYLIDKSCYRIWVHGFVREVSISKDKPIKVDDTSFNNDKVIDILPTSDQMVGLGRQTSISSTDAMGGSLQQTVDHAVGRVLGHSGTTSSSSSFKAALGQAFTKESSDGKDTYVWNPRSYTSTRNELGGAITGAQASLYNRAKAALSDALPLLDGLYPLDPASDPQNRDAVRSIVRTELIELVNEFGVAGGPRAQRVDSLFKVLIGTPEESAQLPEQIGGQLQDLSKVFGLQRSRINTVDEERNFGNFLTIKDYVVSLRQSWNHFMAVQGSGAGAFIGTQLVLLSQGLAVMAESVRETYRIMDLVFLGPEERRSVMVNFENISSRRKDLNLSFFDDSHDEYFNNIVEEERNEMTLEQLMSWAMSFAIDEGPVLAKAGGKKGIANVLAETAKQLATLLQAASYAPVQNSAFRRAGVVRAIRDLAYQTYQVQRWAEALLSSSKSEQTVNVGNCSQLSEFGQADDVGDRPAHLRGTSSYERFKS